MQNIQHNIQWLLQEKYDGKLTEEAKKDIERLKAGEPLDYLIGFVEFLGCKIDVSKKVLIPRIETEYWADIAIGEINDAKEVKILDMFSGSGCIGVAALSQRPKLLCDFADYEDNCLEQIAINCTLNHIDPKRYQIVKSDVFEAIQGKYDYIFANPPYIPFEKKHHIQPSVIEFEPHAALFGGSDGLFFIEKFLAAAKNFLTNNGKIYMEFDSLQKPKIQAMLEKFGYEKFEFQKDQYGKWRHVVVG